jgi:hypothetical protein
MSNEKTENMEAERISRLMVKLNRALVDVVKDDNIRREISFNLSDIREEAARINHIFEEVEVHESITDSQFEDLIYILCTHWSYHIEELKALILQLENDSQL